MVITETKVASNADATVRHFNMLTKKQDAWGTKLGTHGTHKDTRIRLHIQQHRTYTSRRRGPG